MKPPTLSYCFKTYVWYFLNPLEVLQDAFGVSAKHPIYHKNNEPRL